jgi:alpha,alpha-trehalase
VYTSVPGSTILVAASVACVAAVALLDAAGRNPAPILDYIKDTWSVLTRSNEYLARAAADPKYHPSQDGRWPVYVPEQEDLNRVRENLRRVMRAGFDKIELRVLPRGVSQVADQGLLYLPHPYVVPGGRFNEMYGWDSYFIEMGLLRDGKFALAKDMVDNFLYEVRNYGKILNANRTYYLTRSQPPFLTQAILGIYRHSSDRQWLAQSVPAIEQYYRYWTQEPHLTPGTGLSRYYDSGEGPAPEVVASEVDQQGRTDYDLVREYFRSHHITDYKADQYYDAAADRLTPLFYKGDRSMRESGFDPSNRFGPFNADIIHYNPVCLNSLLYIMETESAQILEILGQRQDAEKWRERARVRAGRINHLMWDSAQGMYFDYNFTGKRVRNYPFLTTFYPLWAGIASPQQAAQVVRNLPVFERAGGLQASNRQTGDQWDAPFGWAPLEWIAVQGLTRYGYQTEADRISQEFLSMVLREYEKYGSLSEKYDVVRARSDLTPEILFGYRTNEAGFGWTNAVFTALFDALPASSQRLLVSGRSSRRMGLPETK